MKSKLMTEEIMPALKTFIGIFDKIDNYRIHCENRITTIENMLNDIEHILALGKVDAIGLTALAKRQRELLIERHEFKDEVMLLDSIEKSLGKGVQPLIDRTKDIKKCYESYIQKQKTRYYIPKALPELCVQYKVKTDNVNNHHLIL